MRLYLVFPFSFFLRTKREEIQGTVDGSGWLDERAGWSGVRVGAGTRRQPADSAHTHNNRSIVQTDVKCIETTNERTNSRRAAASYVRHRTATTTHRKIVKHFLSMFSSLPVAISAGGGRPRHTTPTHRTDG